MKLLLLCAGGLSTSLLVSRMKKYAQSIGEDPVIEAHPYGNLDELFERFDMILLGPQISHNLEKVKNRCGHSIKSIRVIDPVDYGLLDGKTVYEKAKLDFTKSGKGKKKTMKDKILQVISDITNHPYVSSLQKGFMSVIGITIAGGIFALLKTPPFPADTTSGFGLAWIAWSQANASWLVVGYELTMNFLAVYVLIGAVYALASHYKMNVLNPIVMGLLSFLILSVNIASSNPENPYAVMNMAMNYLGGQGIFTAIVVSIVVVELLRLMKEKHVLELKLPDAVPPMVSQPFASLFQNLILILIIVLVRIAFSSVGMMFPQIVFAIFTPILKAADTFWAIVLLFAFSRVLWFFGIHGTSVIFAVLMPIVLVNTTENLAAYAAGAEIPHIFAGGFILFQIGMLPAAIAMLIIARSERLKAVAKLGFVPSLFMISEPILFGTPFVLNPILFIPHIAAFAYSVGLAYIAMAVNLVGKPIFSTPSFAPGFITAFLTTGDWKAVPLWLAIVAGSTLIYIPFLKKYDNQLLLEEKEQTLDTEVE